MKNTTSHCTCLTTNGIRRCERCQTAWDKEKAAEIKKKQADSRRRAVRQAALL